MNFRLKKALISGISLLLTVTLAACGWGTRGEDEKDFSESTESTAEESEASAPSEPETRIQTVYRVEYIMPNYVSDAEKEAWREPLVRLISNMKEPVVEDFTIVDYVAPDPAIPSIESSRSFGLMDLNLDGIPELFANLGGGSSGNSFFYVYDIITGEFLGSYNGAGTGSLAAYLNTKTGNIEFFSTTQYRIGATARTRCIERINLVENLERGTTELYTESYFYAYYVFDLLYSEEFGYSEKYSEAEYFVDGDCVVWDEYYDAYDHFGRDYMRIPETAFVMIYGYETYDYEDDRFEKAEKIVDALLSTKQMFWVKPSEK